MTEVANLDSCSSLIYLRLTNNLLGEMKGIYQLQKLAQVLLDGNKNLILTDDEVTFIKSKSHSLPYTYASDTFNGGNLGLTDDDLLAYKNNTTIKTVNISSNADLTYEAIAEVIPTLTGVTWLKMNNLPALKDKSLDFLLIDGEDGEKMAAMPNLASIYIDGDYLINMDALRYFPKLEVIYANNTKVENLNFFLNEDLDTLVLNKVVNVQVTYSSSIKDISALKETTTIRSLSLYGTSVKDISPLANSQALSYLNIGNCNKILWDTSSGDSDIKETSIKNIATLNALSGLTDLRAGGSGADNWQKLKLDSLASCIDNCRNGIDFWGYSTKANWEYFAKELETLSSVVKLFIKNNFPGSLSINYLDLSTCTNLESLSIGGKFKVAAININGCGNLAKLVVNSSNASQHIAFPDISTNTKLTYIEWTDNLLNNSELSNIADALEQNYKNNSSLGKLTLYLNKNAISDISPLSKLATYIDKINLSNNDIYKTNSNVETINLIKANASSCIYSSTPLAN